MQIQLQNKAVSGGVVEKVITAFGRPKQYEGYDTHLFCLSCAYFQQTKGHFGFCNQTPDKKIFDGSKKGSACLGWRIKSGLTNQIILEPTPEKIIQESYKSLVRITRKEKTTNQIFNSKDKLDFNVERDRVHNLPYVLTSDAKISKTFPNHRTSGKIISYAIKLFNEGRDFGYVERKIKETFAYNISTVALRQWRYKFIVGLYRELPNIKNKEIDGQCKKCGSKNIIKFGISYKKYGASQRMKCFMCKHTWLIQDDYNKYQIIAYRLNLLGKNSRQIQDWLFSKYQIMISYVTIFYWLRAINKAFKINKEKTQSIIDGLREKFEVMI